MLHQVHYRIKHCMCKIKKASYFFSILLLTHSIPNYFVFFLHIWKQSKILRFLIVIIQPGQDSTFLSECERILRKEWDIVALCGVSHSEMFCALFSGQDVDNPVGKFERRMPPARSINIRQFIWSSDVHRWFIDRHNM